MPSGEKPAACAVYFLQSLGYGGEGAVGYDGNDAGSEQGAKVFYGGGEIGYLHCFTYWHSFWWSLDGCGGSSFGELCNAASPTGEGDIIDHAG